MQDAQIHQSDAQPLASTSSYSSPPPSRTRANERSRRKRHLASGMLALLCGSTPGAMDDLMTPIERSKRDGPPSPAVSKGSVDEKEGGHATSDSATSKPKPTRLPSRRPSVRQRMQSLSRMSDRALSTAAGSINPFRRGSASQCNVPPMPSHSHSRGASLSSFASGKSSGSSSSKRVIGSPSAFKHQFHLGPDAPPSSPWDESRWRQIVEMKNPDLSEDPEIIDVSFSASASKCNSDPAVSPPRASTSTEYCGPVSELARSLSTSRTHGRSASHSHSSTDDGGFPAFAAKMASATASSPNLLVLANGSSVNLVGEDGKTPKQLKRSSLVKRKPVPPLYPEEPSPALSQTLSGTSLSMAPASKTEFHLMPDLPMEPAPTPRPLSPTTPVTLTHSPEQTSPTSESSFPPEHIVVSRPTSPAPTIPPRRHTLAHTASIRSRSPPNLLAKKILAPTIDTRVASVNDNNPVEAPRPAQQPNAVEAVKEERETSQDSSPKPSFSSLISASASEWDSSPEPRTPTDDRRASAGSAASVGVLIIGPETCVKSVDNNADGTDVGMSEVKKRSPPACRSPVDEETVYVTADEAETETE